MEAKMKPKSAEIRDFEFRRLPRMLLLRQLFQNSSIHDIPSAMDREFSKFLKAVKFPVGAEIAVVVGSRGIANLPIIVHETVKQIRTMGGRPFIVPGMGSHGGATAEGQVRILEHLGITEESTSAPIRATMKVINIGKTPHGIPVYVDQFAYDADGIVIINRIKPHTDFVGEIESGVMKMLAIGLGKQKGADLYHRLILEKGYIPVISDVAKKVLKRLNVLFAIQVVENEKDQTSTLKCTPASTIEDVEKSLQIEAKRMLPSIPFDDIDLLIIDEMGKDISGPGMDPNVTGRNVVLSSQSPNKPRITRIFVRELTAGSEGSAVGIGNADFTSARLVKAIDIKATAVNCITGCAPECGRIPLAFDKDKEAIEAAFACIRPVKSEDLRLVYIKNTLCLEEFLASEAFLEEIRQKEQLSILNEDAALIFDENQNLISPFLK
jgi:hypothetical protein